MIVNIHIVTTVLCPYVVVVVIIIIIKGAVWCFPHQWYDSFKLIIIPQW